MSLMNCEIHGEIGVIPYVSKDLCQFIINKENISLSKIKSIHVIFYDEGEILLDRYYFFSIDLFNRLLLKEYYEIISDEDESIFTKLTREHLGAVCVGCFKGYMNNIGYKYKL